jgi:murein DD-endopeptidase MepM/ murein hydrolase activator NlpD
MNRTWLRLALSVLAVAALVGGYFVYQWFKTNAARSARLVMWLRDAPSHPDWAVHAGERCGEAPFLTPTDGFIGYLWDDSFRPGQRHQGIDIFGGGEAGLTPVMVAYSGYLTRQPDWKSTLALRIPNDPLQPGRQIWTYYTHMADRDGNSFIAEQFPPGTSDVYVEAGTLLGYQGNYSGDPANPVGVHLHFSIVLDGGADQEYPSGKLRNELDIRNTLDPSPYFGISLNANRSQGKVPVCVK